MDATELFFAQNLPKPFTNEELNDYFAKMKKGDLQAREEIIKHNIKLVLNQVLTKFSTLPCEQKDLVPCGLIGLIKAVNTYDLDKGFQFTTYAVRCINNEILMFYRSTQKTKEDLSLESSTGFNENGEEITLRESLADSSDFVSQYINREKYKTIRQVIETLPEKEQFVVIKFFGFGGNAPLSQEEIAMTLGFSQSYVSRILKSALVKIREELKNKEIIELTTKKTNKKRKAKNIYDFFPEYNKEWIDQVISELNEEDRILLQLRYEVINDPNKKTKWEKKQNNLFYNRLIPKMQQSLEIKKRAWFYSPNFTKKAMESPKL